MSNNSYTFENSGLSHTVQPTVGARQSNDSTLQAPNPEISAAVSTAEVAAVSRESVGGTSYNHQNPVPWERSPYFTPTATPTPETAPQQPTTTDYYDDEPKDSICLSCSRLCLCACLARCGLRWCGYNRKFMMWLVCGLLTFFSLLCCLVGCLGLIDNASIVKDFAWAKYRRSANMKSYGNLQAIAVESSAGTLVFSYGDFENYQAQQAQSFASSGIAYKHWTVSDCKDSVESLRIMMITATAMKLLTFLNCYRRGSDHDNGCVKLQMAVTMTLQCLLLMVHLGTYYRSCFDDIPENFNSKLGVGFVTVFMGFIFLCTVLLISLFVPCPEKTPKSGVGISMSTNQRL